MAGIFGILAGICLAFALRFGLPNLGSEHFGCQQSDQVEHLCDIGIIDSVLISMKLSNLPV